MEISGSSVSTHMLSDGNRIPTEIPLQRFDLKVSLVENDLFSYSTGFLCRTRERGTCSTAGVFLAVMPYIVHRALYYNL